MLSIYLRRFLLISEKQLNLATALLLFSRLVVYPTMHSTIFKTKKLPQLADLTVWQINCYFNVYYSHKKKEIHTMLFKNLFHR